MKKLAKPPLIFILGVFLLAACTPASAPTATTLPKTDQPTAGSEATAVSEPVSTAAQEEAPVDVSGPPDCEDPFKDARLAFRVEFWDKTNFCLHSIDYSEIFSGGPPPDGIPPIDEPVFESVAEADEWLGDEWPVIFFEHEGDVRAYPLAILMWHEIVNDEYDGLYVTITFCPLCNATIAFNRTLPDGTVLDFGTSGNLRNSDLVMYDRQTQSWWQQFTGTGIVGEYTGTQLEFLPSQIVSWADFKENHPEGQVLSRNTGQIRSYGTNPYTGYDDINNSPFLYTGVVDGRLSAMERVVAVSVPGASAAYPFSELAKAGVANDTLGEINIVVFWKGGTTSALDTRDFSDAREVGSTAVFSRDVDGQTLTFVNDGETWLDNETGSRWNVFGEAIEGELAGTQLEQIVSAEHFWFAWAAFIPDTEIWVVE